MLARSNVMLSQNNTLSFILQWFNSTGIYGSLSECKRLQRLTSYIELRSDLRNTVLILVVQK